MNYVRQIIFEMRHHKMMIWVSVSGIALSIFLIMVFFMVDRLPMVEAAPESHRSRMLYGGGLEIMGENWSQSGAMSYKTSGKIYGNLDGIEMTARSSSWTSSCEVGQKGKLSNPMDVVNTDAEFWKMYDFRFVSGKPYDKATVESGGKSAVLTRSVARKIYGRDDVAGEEVRINSVPYTVAGVVEDVNPVMNATFSNVYIPFPPEDLSNGEDFGNVMVHLLMQPGVEEDEIKSQVKSRYERWNAELKKDHNTAVYHNAPHDSEYLADGWLFSNVTPDLIEKHRTSYITYILLMLLPAINLSCMMRGRLRHRVSEIGVRRAFGARRRSIIAQILTENMIVTIFGGLIGLIISIIFIYLAADYFFTLSDTDTSALEFASSTPALSMLFTWTNFFIAIAACFVLNLLSAFLPAWKASRLEPAVAIAKSKM